MSGSLREKSYMLFVIACIASFIPYTALFLWLRSRRREDPFYKKLCGRALGFGVLSVLPVTLFSGISYVIVRLTVLGNRRILLLAEVNPRNMIPFSKLLNVLHISS